jgi:hypothetical protein
MGGNFFPKHRLLYSYYRILNDALAQWGKVVDEVSAVIQAEA